MGDEAFDKKPGSDDPLSALEGEMSGKSGYFGSEDALKALEEEAAGDDMKSAAPAWKPTEAGESLVGMIASIFTATGEYGESQAAVVRPRSGVEETVYFSSTVLRNQFDRQKPQVGDLIAVKFLGEQENTKTGRVYKNFVVKTVRQ